MERDSSRYRGLVAGLGRECLARSAGAPVLAQARGWPVSVGAAAARVLLGEPADAAQLEAGRRALVEAGGLEGGAEGAAEGAARFNDTFGFSRPVYHPLLVHLYRRAGCPVPFRDGPGAGAGQVRGAGEGDVGLALWWALCRYERGAAGDAEAARAAVQRIVDRPGPEGSLHPRREDDQLDAWTYRELTGLHALARLALADDHGGWKDRVHEIARHHQALTQPDYTTYQPWAVFAFLGHADTAMFGEQQLHDTQTNLHVETAGAGMLAGLLLADAADAMVSGPTRDTKATKARSHEGGATE